ncbi:Rv1681 family radical SAM protein [Mycolicibacterium vanbaalenii]|uniref:Radical SAM domain protein n=1 Tax=Mycolicibacterium vanbaalenii (strain DSM 7251 / JCM 13017 / BCRC 16820 / KCTC 9966 / NRRL B-24157 / PYR-1) TaxID=350058 RepID=A1THJ8_MYCVP|nr:radical SAM protein [Mycolicibacterium vanbaalenii]ABM16648.1 Radical SAM domain protein [Mycolicibacterium vanbaalenii PYR-1]
MVILDLMRLMATLADGAVGEIAVASVAERETAEKWCARSGNTVVQADLDETGAGTLTVRRGRPPDPLLVLGPERMPGARLWMYTNFHCNLACDYCCVESSPQAPRRELGADRIARLAREAADWGVREVFLTGGEPFLLSDIGTIVRSCAALLPTTVLTNGMVFRGRGLRELDAIPRDNVALQISLDSATSELHDSHRGHGSWARAVEGIRVARGLGFRVRVAATVAAPVPGELKAFHDFLDELGIAQDDQVVRPVAREGSAADGVQITRASLVPEVAVTAEGVYWHPVAAIDDDALVTRQIEPLAPALDEIAHAFAELWARKANAAQLFPCA